MTQSDPAGPQEDEHRPQAAPLLPLVSVVIVNYNYARFLEEAVDSVFAQTYPRVECVIVDNASTDNSAVVIARCRHRHRDLRVIERARNGGQSLACAEGLRATSGPYVVFLDADDYLLPHGLERHIQVHLSSRVHAGFTFGDTLQMSGDDVVLSTNEPMATFIRKQSASEGDVALLRPTQAALQSLWATFDRTLPDRVRLVPRHQTAWVWSPTSGNCFRRDALDLFCDCTDLENLKSQTDLFLTVGINALCGSILIDEPVFVYRLHGENVFSSRPQLAGMLAYDRPRTDDNTLIARRLLFDHFLRHARRFVQDTWQITLLFGILRRLDRADSTATGWRRRSMLLAACARHFPVLAPVVGKTRALLFLAWHRMPLPVLWRLARFDRLPDEAR